MKKLTQVFRFLKGNRLTYLGALLAILFNVALSALIPMVIQHTLDSVIGTEPLDLPGPVVTLINHWGGVTAIRDNLWVLLLIVLVLYGAQGLFLFMRGKLAAVTGENTSRRLRNRLYRHLLRQPYDYHVKSQTGDIIQRCTSDIETFQNFVQGQSIEAISIITQVIIVMTIMFTMDVRYTLITVALIPIILIVTIRFFMSMMTVFLETDESEGVMSSALQENLTGVRVVKAFAAQPLEIEKFDKKNRVYRENIMRIIKLMSTFWSISDFLCMLQFVIVVMAGTWLTASGEITLGTMVAFLTYAGMLIWPIRGLGQMMGFMGQAFVSLGRIQEILDSPAEDDTSGRKDLEIKGEIVFDHVHFGYQPDQPVLDDLSLTIRPGTTTAILGATGSGKSTLLHLLLRLYDYQQGSIRIDGVELKKISRSWIRRNIGLVLQEPFLFSRNLTENIRIGHPGSSVEDVEEAARLACVHEAILGFDEGYATMVGERGVTLSGGQRQRVAIARTLLRQVPILIFDDSLSAVDTETDATIRKALRKRNKQTTTLIISHRITTLAEADQILVMDQGRIVQRGTHEQLIREDGHYRRIWELQSQLDPSEEGA